MILYRSFVSELDFELKRFLQRRLRHEGKERSRKANQDSMSYASPPSVLCCFYLNMVTCQTYYYTSVEEELPPYYKVYLQLMKMWKLDPIYTHSIY